MATIHIVDAGVLFSDWTKKQPTLQLATTIGILEELNNRPSFDRAESMISIGRLIIESVEVSRIEEANEAARDTGDISVLSTQDMELIGLGLQRRNAGYDVVIVSSDLALLNTARHLGLVILDPMKRMQHAIQWVQKCPACGHISNDPDETECIVCGTEMRRKMKARQKIR